MGQTIKHMGNRSFSVYGDIMPLTSMPPAPVKFMDAAQKQKTMSAATRKKLERVLELLEKEVAGGPDSVPKDRTTAAPRLMKESTYRRLTPCEEAEAAYAARNPHKAR